MVDLLEHAGDIHEGRKPRNPSHPRNTKELSTEDEDTVEGRGLEKAKPNHNN